MEVDAALKTSNYISPDRLRQLKQLNVSQSNIQMSDSEANTAEPEVQILHSKSQTTYEEIQMTDPDIQVADQISSVSITEPLSVQVPEDVKQEMTMKLSQHEEHEFAVESHVFG